MEFKGFINGFFPGKGLFTVFSDYDQESPPPEQPPPEQTPTPPPGVYPPPAQPPGQHYQNLPPGTGGGVSNAVKIILGTGCGCLGLVGLACIGLIIWLAFLPESGALPGSRITPETREYLYSHDLLSSDEEVIYYYDATIKVDNSESCFFTDQKIAYYKEGSMTAIPWDEVKDIDGRDDLNFVISVGSTGNEFLTCEIAPLNGGPEFYKALVSTWENKLEEME